MSSAEAIADGALLRAFAAFAEHRNFTTAARAVGLSQPALFERVKRLGEALGVPLYERAGRSLELTPQGVQVAAHARETLARGEAFARELRGEVARETVTLAAGEGSFLYLLGPALAGFVRGESAGLRLLTLGGAATAEAVKTGEAQLGVAAIDLVPRGLEARDVTRTALCAAMRATHPLARRRTVRLADLASTPLVLPPPGRTHREFVGRAIARLGVEVAPPVEADGWPLMLNFAALGLGVAVVNGLCELPRGVVARPIPELGTVTYRLLRRRGAPASSAVDDLAARVMALAERRTASKRSG